MKKHVLAVLFVALSVGCGSRQHEAAGSAWRADLSCVEDPVCKQRGPDCVATAPPDTLVVEQCGGTEKPPPPPEERADYERKRKQDIAARTWACVCHCAAEEQRRLEQCAQVP